MAQTIQRDSIVDEYLRRSDLTGERVQGHSPGYVIPAKAKSTKRKSLSTFNIILFLFVFAVVSVLYISNIIAVNTLLKEISQLEQRYDTIRNNNEILRAEYNRRTALDNIGSAALDRLGLQYPKDPPLWITIDKKDVERLQREFRRKQN